MVTSYATMTVLDPTAETVFVPADMAPRPSTLETQRIGLLANGKANSEELLQAVLGQLAKNYEFATVATRNKGDASRPAPPEILEELKRECDVVITATGD